MRLKDIKYIVINYGDSEFTSNMLESANSFCEDVNKELSYWINTNNMVKYNSTVLQRMTNIDYIRKEITNKIIGSYFKEVLFDDIININDFNYILDFSQRLTSDIKYLTEEEFNDIKKELRWNRYVVIKHDDTYMTCQIY